MRGGLTLQESREVPRLTRQHQVQLYRHHMNAYLPLIGVSYRLYASCHTVQILVTYIYSLRKYAETVCARLIKLS